MVESITVLGATGSIGVSTLDVIARHPERYQIFALTAYSQADKLFEQCLATSPRYAVLGRESDAENLQLKVREAGLDTEVLVGLEGLKYVAGADSVDTVVAAIVGGAGLLPTMTAVEAGKKVLLANKEALVMAGHLFMDAVVRCNAQLLPVDSEHNAIFQCLPSGFKSLHSAGVTRLLLTGSGGPFREVPVSDLSNITPAQAIAHPNWDMGAKISVDSATMMNKGLEYIEACWLFGAAPSEVEVVVHPQSVVHSMVEYADGSVLCQMGMPDMRTPIASCLAWPERIAAGVKRLDFAQIGSLTFEAPDYQRFPCLKLAIDAAHAGGYLPAVVNAANEVAVAEFLACRIGFLDIAKIVSIVAGQWQGGEPSHLDDVISADREARALAAAAIAAL